jgi:hypothetical protein
MQSRKVAYCITDNHQRIVTKIAATRAELEKVKDQFGTLTKSSRNAELYGGFNALIDPFKRIKYTISDRYNTPSVSLQWIKMIEILTYYRLIQYIMNRGIGEKEDLFSFRRDLHVVVDDDEDGDEHDPFSRYDMMDDISVYDDTGIPGHFLLAIYHYYFSQLRGSEVSNKFKWYVNSQTESVEDDQFRLYENYRDTNHCVTFDTLTYNGIMDAVRHFDDTAFINLFVSDRNVDLDGKYDRQEELHIHSNYSQICLAMGLLGEGGCMITKQFTISHPATLSLLGRAAGVFDEMHICKPESSRSDNSEVFVVGIGFKLEAGRSLFNELIRELKEFDMGTYTADSLQGNVYLKSLYQNSVAIMTSQMEAITRIITTFENYKANPEMVKRQIYIKQQDIVKVWYERINLIPLDQRDHLNIYNTTKYLVRSAPVRTVSDVQPKKYSQSQSHTNGHSNGHDHGYDHRKGKQHSFTPHARMSSGGIR